VDNRDRLVGLCASVLIYGTMTCPNRFILPVLEFGPLTWVGKVSYGLYLWHIPMIHLVKELKLDPVPTMLLSFGATFAVATASFYLYERPFLRLKQRFSADAPRAEIAVSLIR
jgi:peptidoglycan/LPS O-acetylase OafA/YrhL